MTDDVVQPHVHHIHGLFVALGHGHDPVSGLELVATERRPTRNEVPDHGVLAVDVQGRADSLEGVPHGDVEVLLADGLEPQRVGIKGMPKRPEKDLHDVSRGLLVEVSEVRR